MAHQGHDEVARTIAAAQETMDQLALHDIAPTPRHYELWFTYVTGAHPALSAEIAARIARGEALDAHIFAQLFERHLAKSPLSAQMLAASESIARELSGVVAALRSTGDQTGAYASVLADAAAAFDGALEPQTLRSLVNGLSGATRDMARRNSELSEKMMASTREVEKLQTALRHVQIEARTDGLTGLANRKAFDEALVKRIGEVTGDLCLLLCDIDHFKRFNDTWGHLVGDQVIRLIAQVLKQHAGGEFLAARYGGEEFAVIMPGANMHRAQEIAAAIRQAVKTKKLTRKSTGETIGAVTISIGLARRRVGDGPTNLVKRADLCLYASKQAGRDRVTIDSELPAAAVA